MTTKRTQYGRIIGVALTDTKAWNLRPSAAGSTDERQKRVTLGIRRTSILALCFVVMMTTVGFACLLFAASALGMPAQHEMSGCGMPIEGAVACPHDNPGPAATAGSVDSAPQITAALALASVSLPPAGATDPCMGDSGRVPDPPLSHLTPLRI